MAEEKLWHNRLFQVFGILAGIGAVAFMSLVGVGLLNSTLWPTVGPWLWVSGILTGLCFAGLVVMVVAAFKTPRKPKRKTLVNPLPPLTDEERAAIPDLTKYNPTPPEPLEITVPQPHDLTRAFRSMGDLPQWVVQVKNPRSRPVSVKAQVQRLYYLDSNTEMATAKTPAYLPWVHEPALPYEVTLGSQETGTFEVVREAGSSAVRVPLSRGEVYLSDDPSKYGMDVIVGGQTLHLEVEIDNLTVASIREAQEPRDDSVSDQAQARQELEQQRRAQTDRLATMQGFPAPSLVERAYPPPLYGVIEKTGPIVEPEDLERLRVLLRDGKRIQLELGSPNPHDWNAIREPFTKAWEWRKAVESALPMDKAIAFRAVNWMLDKRVTPPDSVGAAGLSHSRGSGFNPMPDLTTSLEWLEITIDAMCPNTHGPADLLGLPKRRTHEWGPPKTSSVGRSGSVLDEIRSRVRSQDRLALAGKLETLLLHGEDLHNATAIPDSEAMWEACQDWFASALAALPATKKASFRQTNPFPTTTGFRVNRQYVNLNDALAYLGSVIEELKRGD